MDKLATGCSYSIVLIFSFMCNSVFYSSSVVSGISRKKSLICRSELGQSRWSHCARTPWRQLILIGLLVSQNLYTCASEQWSYSTMSFHLQICTDICHKWGSLSTQPLPSDITYSWVEGIAKLMLKASTCRGRLCGWGWYWMHFVRRYGRQMGYKRK